MTASQPESTSHVESIRQWLLNITDNNIIKGSLTLGPVLFLLTILYGIPLIMLLLFSFTEDPGLVNVQLTLSQYARIFDLQSIFALDLSSLPYLKLLYKSLKMSLIVTVICAIFCYPVTYYIGQKAPKKYKSFLLILLIIPFWTSYLIRTFSLVPILSQDGIINGVLMAAGLPQVDLLYTSFATQIGLIYVFVPFMILPMYASMDGLDYTLIEAAMDLGAGRVRVFVEVIFPLTLPGTAAGFIFVFIKCAAAFVTPTLLGGRGGTLYTNIIVTQFREAYAWNFGAALVFVLFAAVVIILFIGWKLNAVGADSLKGGI